MKVRLFCQPHLRYAFTCSFISLESASLRTATKGPLPDGKRHVRPDGHSFAELRKPASVLPAPGTPVTKQMLFVRALFEYSITSAIAEAVKVRFLAPASLRVS